MEKGQEHFVPSRLCVRCWCPKFQVGRVLWLMGLATHQWQVKGLSEEDYEKNSSKIRLISCGVWWELWLRKVLWKTCFIRRWENSALKTAESRAASLLGSSGLPTPSKKEEKFRMIRIKVLGHNWKLRKRISQMHCSAPFGDLIKYSELFPSPDGLNYIFFFCKTYVILYPVDWNCLLLHQTLRSGSHNEIHFFFFLKEENCLSWRSPQKLETNLIGVVISPVSWIIFQEKSLWVFCGEGENG